MPTVYVAGNHDHYGQVYGESMESGRRAAEEFPHVHFLEKDEVVLGGVRFLGTTMWTDFALYGDADDHADHAWRGMNDYHQIYDRSADGHLVHWTPDRTRELHAESRAWLRQALATSFDGPTVVVTHHCPHPMSIAKRFAGDKLTPAFCSNLSAEIGEYQPALWVHGHTHANFDYVVPGTATRVVCNPRGYVRENFDRGLSVENPNYDPVKTVVI